MPEINLSFVMDVVVTLVCGAIALIHRGALPRFASQKYEFGAKVIVTLATVTAIMNIVLTWVFDQPLWAQILGCVIAISGLPLFLSAMNAAERARFRLAFDHGFPIFIMMEGPYRYLRHPLYTSYMILWSGWALATYTVWSIPFVVIVLISYIVAAASEERKLSQSHFAKDYEAYRKQTGPFWPRFKRKSAS